MLHIETAGSWREMGRQMGEAWRALIPEMMERMAPRLEADLPRYESILAELRANLSQHAPELLEETAGMAEGGGQDGRLMFAFRFANHVAHLHAMQEGCSLAYMADTDHGPLLARNGDMAAHVPKVQVRRTCRPTEGPATIQTLYFGQFSGHGMNEYGLAQVGASAHTSAHYPGKKGLPPAILGHLMLHRCHDLNEAEVLMTQLECLGKASVMILADPGGESLLLERPSGRTPLAHRRRPDRAWQVITNFFPSGEIPIKPDQQYLQSAYARYGRLVHQLDEGLVPHTLAGLKRLMGDVAKNGLCCDGGKRNTVTGYSQIFELRSGTMHLCVGSPAEGEYEAIPIHEARIPTASA